MEFSRFSLGLRFAMTPYAGLTPEQVLSLLFSRVFSGLVEGLNLYCMWDDTAKDEPEPAFVCVFSNASLRRAKKLFGALSEDTQLCSYLTAFQPFVQNNLVEKCGAVQFIGTVGKDGGVTGGDVSYGEMRFFGPAPAVYSELVRRPRILIAPEALPSVPSADASRQLARSVACALPAARILPLRIADGGRGTLDTLLAACHGRYMMLEKTALRSGVLPDRTVVLETEGMDGDLQTAAMQEIFDKGYRSILLAAGHGALVGTVPAGVSVQVLCNLPAETLPAAEDVTYCSGIETVLERSGFLGKLCDAAAVLTCAAVQDDACRMLGSTVDTILFHCRQKKILTAVLAAGPDGGYYFRKNDEPAFPLHADTLSSAADEAALLLSKLLA